MYVSFLSCLLSFLIQCFGDIDYIVFTYTIYKYCNVVAQSQNDGMAYTSHVVYLIRLEIKSTKFMHWICKIKQEDSVVSHIY